MLFTWIALSYVLALGENSAEFPRTFCGRALSEAQTLYCLEAELAEKKSQVPENLSGNEMYQQKHDPVPLDNADSLMHVLKPLGWASKKTVHALHSRRKRSPGIIDECCLKPCHLSELVSYC